MSKDRQHEFTSEIKRIAFELGRTPTRDEFHEMSKLPRREQDRLFGGFVQLVHAAGLEVRKESSSKNRREEIKKAFHRDIDADLNKSKPREYNMAILPGWRGIFIGDPHSPITSTDALTGLYSLIDYVKPTVIGSVGDDYDFFNWSRFSPSRNWYTPKQELMLARKVLDDMWKNIRSLAPKARLVSVMGNHNLRPIKTLLSKCPEMEIFCDLDKWMAFDGVETFLDPRQIVMINNETEISHGHWSKPGEYCMTVKRNVIHGHTHKGLTTHVTLADGRVVWEASAGHFADINALPMQYTPKETNPRWARGVLLVDEMGPRFIHL